MLLVSLPFSHQVLVVELTAHSPQLVILNACSMVGRLTPGFFVKQFGVENMFIFASFACSAVMFGMIGLKSVVGVVMVAICYGFFAGSSMLDPLTNSVKCGLRSLLAVALMGPTIIGLSPSFSQIGYVVHYASALIW